MLRRGEPGHVLYQSEYGLVHTFVSEHVHTLLDVGKRHVLRSGDDDGSLHRDVVHKGDMDVAGARRHVYQEEVEFAPVHLQDHLLQGVAGHGAAPDEGLAPVGEIAYAHPFDAELFGGEYPLLPILILDRLGYVAFGAGHHRHGRAVYVGVGQADPVAHAGQGDGQVHRDGGFADASLAGGDADDVPYVLDLLEVKVQHIGFFLRRSFVHDDGLHLVLHSGELPVKGGACTAHQILRKGVAPFRKAQRDRNFPFGGLNGVHHPELDDVLVALAGMAHERECLQDFLFRHYYLTMFISSRR